MLKVVATVAVLVGCALNCAAALAQTEANTDVPQGLLHLAVAAPADEGKFGIIQIDPGGMGKRRLVSDPRAAMEPTWSPDGKSLAFVSYRTGQGQIFVADLASGKAV